MATTEDVRKLAALARIRVEEAELEKFTREFDSILAYVGQLEKLEIPEQAEEKPLVRNVMREDSEPHEGGMYTEALVKQFPAQEDRALSVKQIITHE
jgi:aspartyl-tRNA(Asn)/glutamyl-tRNA(Gln) amidotransferase subunit C